MLFLILLLNTIAACGCLKTKKIDAFKPTDVMIVNVETDKPEYAPGDTVAGTVLVQNIGGSMINELTIWMTAKNLNYWWAGTKAQIRFPIEYKDLNLMPGENATLEAALNIPEDVGGYSTAGEYEIKIEVNLGTVLCDRKVFKMTVR